MKMEEVDGSSELYLHFEGVPPWHGSLVSLSFFVTIGFLCNHYQIIIIVSLLSLFRYHRAIIVVFVSLSLNQYHYAIIIKLLS